jgi:hypothetical protein
LQRDQQSKTAANNPRASSIFPVANAGTSALRSRATETEGDDDLL